MAKKAPVKKKVVTRKPKGEEGDSFASSVESKRLVDIETESEEVSPKGLGDTVEKVLEKTGVAKVAKKILGDDCGCKERKEWLNKAFPYVMIKKGTMNDDQVGKWKEFRSEKRLSLNVQDQEFVISLYNSVFQSNIQPCIGCGNGKTWSTYISRLDSIVNDELK